MSSYSQWLASHAKSGPSRVTWVCGEARVLVDEVIAATVGAIVPDDTEGWRLGRDVEREIWASVLAIPGYGRSRLVIVGDAGRLRDWKSLRWWLDARNLTQGSYLLFGAEENDFPRDGDGKIAEPVSWLRDSSVGQIVRCSPLNPEDAVAWVQRQLPSVTPVQAKRLLFRAAGDLAEIRHVLVKARLFSGSQMTDEAFDMLCDELPDDFAERLILRDLPGAMLAAESLVGDGLARAIGYLASRLQLLSTLHRAARDGVSWRDIVANLGVSRFLVQKYYAIASAEYGERRVNSAWVALSAAEDVYRGGAVDGVAESLVVSWWA